MVQVLGAGAGGGEGVPAVMLAPLVLPVVVGALIMPFAGVRRGLVVALLWLLGSADDLADWVRLWG